MVQRFDRRSNNSSDFRSKPGRKGRDFIREKSPSEMEGSSKNRTSSSKYRQNNSESSNDQKEFSARSHDPKGKDRGKFDRQKKDHSSFSEARNNRGKPKNSKFKDSERNFGSRYKSEARNHFRSPATNRTSIEGNGQTRSLSSDSLEIESTSDDLLWGRHSTQAALESGRPIHRIWCTPELRSSPKFFQLLKESKGSGVLVEEVTWARLGQLTGGAVHQGIALQIASSETLDLKSLINACDVIDEAPLLLALDGVTDPQNLGAIIRSAEALGAHGLILPQRRSAGLTGSVAKVAAGALEHLPVSRVVNLNRALQELRNVGYKIIGLAEEGDITLAETDLNGPLVLVTGSENKGISLLTRKHCDYLVRIPLRGEITSLNASVATALVLYEVARSTWMKGLSGQAPSPRMTRAKPFSSSNWSQD